MSTCHLVLYLFPVLYLFKTEHTIQINHNYLVSEPRKIYMLLLPLQTHSHTYTHYAPIRKEANLECQYHHKKKNCTVSMNCWYTQSQLINLNFTHLFYSFLFMYLLIKILLCTLKSVVVCLKQKRHVKAWEEKISLILNGIRKWDVTNVQGIRKCSKELERTPSTLHWHNQKWFRHSCLVKTRHRANIHKI